MKPAAQSTTLLFFFLFHTLHPSIFRSVEIWGRLSSLVFPFLETIFSPPNSSLPAKSKKNCVKLGQQT